MDLLGAVLTSILWDAITPFVFIPALLLGWWARQGWVVVAGAVAIAAVQFCFSLTETLPPGAERIYWLEPVGIIAPLGLGFAAFGLRRWLARRDKVAPGSPGPRLLRAAIGFFVGGAVGFGIGLALGFAVVEIAQVSAREGGAGYLIAFLFVLPGTFLGAIAGAVIGWRRSRAVAR